MKRANVTVHRPHDCVDTSSFLFEAEPGGSHGPFFSAEKVQNTPGESSDWVGAPIPIPGAVWLFGSALAGLGWLGRKQTV